MPSYKVEYQIVLSSPSDIAEERQIASDVIAEVNQSWAEPAGAVLKLLKWEDAAPAFAEEPQAVINKTLGDSWDIYLGIMHARFGAPTLRFDSGTEEEFSRALELWRTDPSRRRLMFYFKNAPVNFDQIDPDQIGKVRRFKESFKGVGGLYKEFTDASAFRDMLRAHLTSVLMELHKAAPVSTGLLSSVKDSENEQASIETPDGIVDLIESAVAGLNSAAEVLGGIGDLMAEGTAVIQSNTNLMNEAVERGDLAGIRKATSGFSRHMVVMATGLAEKRREYGSHSRTALEAFSTAISMAKAMAPDGKFDSGTLVASMTEASEMMQSFADTIFGTERTIDTLPNIAKEFGRARISLKRELSMLRTELNASISLVRELVIIANAE